MAFTIPTTAQQLGSNVRAEQKDKILVLYIDTTVEIGASKSGKNMIIGSTNGNANLAGVTVGLNVYKKRTA